MLSQIQTVLIGHPWLPHLVYLESVDSTNSYARRLASQGAPEGTVILANHQTGGRGRMGRSFSSPAGMGIYLSVILRPNCPPQELMHLTCAAGLAAVEAVANTTPYTPGIKWTNDLILSGRKLGGILTELSIESGLVSWAIVGIGINCCQHSNDFPAELRDMAISLELQPSQRYQLAAELIRSLHRMRKRLLCQQEAIVAEFSGHCVTIGQEISILQGTQLLHGKALGVENDGALTVQLTDGTVRRIVSGEVSIRGMYGYI